MLVAGLFRSGNTNQPPVRFHKEVEAWLRNVVASPGNRGLRLRLMGCLVD